MTFSLSSGKPSAITAKEMMATVCPSENVTCNVEFTYVMFI